MKFPVHELFDVDRKFTLFDSNQDVFTELLHSLSILPTI